MHTIEGIWEGIGTDILLKNNGLIKKTQSKLVMNITHVENDVYLVKTLYIFLDGGFDTEETFLIQRDNDNFISEDPTGYGINFFDFKKDNCSNKLFYKYNLNGHDVWPCLCGNYELDKKNM